MSVRGAHGHGADARGRGRDAETEEEQCSESERQACAAAPHRTWIWERRVLLTWPISPCCPVVTRRRGGRVHLRTG